MILCYPWMRMTFENCHHLFGNKAICISSGLRRSVNQPGLGNRWLTICSVDWTDSSAVRCEWWVPFWWCEWWDSFFSTAGDTSTLCRERAVDEECAIDSNHCSQWKRGKSRFYCRKPFLIRSLEDVDVVLDRCDDDLDGNEPRWEERSSEHHSLVLWPSFWFLPLRYFGFTIVEIGLSCLATWKSEKLVPMTMNRDSPVELLNSDQSPTTRSGFFV